jgi:hypothetical protein
MYFRFACLETGTSGILNFCSFYGQLIPIQNVRMDDNEYRKKIDNNELFLNHDGFYLRTKIFWHPDYGKQYQRSGFPFYSESKDGIAQPMSTEPLYLVRGLEEAAIYLPELLNAFAKQLMYFPSMNQNPIHSKYCSQLPNQNQIIFLNANLCCKVCLA